MPFYMDLPPKPTLSRRKLARIVQKKSRHRQHRGIITVACCVYEFVGKRRRIG